MSDKTQFPFIFDAEKMGEMFKMPEFDKMFEHMQMPMAQFDMDAMIKAQQKNVQAFVEANKAAMAGYQEIYRRQVALVEEQMAKAKDQIGDLQSQPLSAEASSKSMEGLKETLDRLMAEVREMAEMAQQTNAEAFGIVKARFDEGIAEMKAAAEKMTA